MNTTSLNRWGGTCAILLGLTYVVIACLVIGGVGIMMAVSRTRTKDPPLK